MSSLHPTAMTPRDGSEHFAMPTVRADAPLSDAAAEFLRTGAVVLGVVDPVTQRQVGLLFRRALGHGRARAIRA